MKTQVRTVTKEQVANVEKLLKTHVKRRTRSAVDFRLDGGHYMVRVAVYQPIQGEDDVGYLDPLLFAKKYEGIFEQVAVDLSFHESLVGDYVFHDGETRIDLRIEEEA